MARRIIALGVVAGSFMAGVHWLVATICVSGTVGFDQAMLAGYAGMVLALSIVFFGIRSYRDSGQAGDISFGEAMQIGLLITFVASVIHATGAELYNLVNPDFKSLFLDKFREYKMEALAQPPSPDAVEALNREVAIARQVYENPILDFMVSLIGIMPVGFAITLVSAALLRKTASRRTF